ncbi:hypothetical protein PVBG_05192 [Plasmodium vivax Brazil I]|uniref:Variable surface protein n=1 Tax=Plasmodium vivax (strain Brazil I) TaxID=1033975 RepID=A0A0J9SMI7_PLAV1|nr:hypothetical protein PVBG_05192 [Plasmodium vivax Brazil I]
MIIQIISIKNIIICKYYIILINCKDLIDLNISINLWGTYNEFDKTLEGDVKKFMYHTFCDLAMKKYTENIQEQSTFCLKLIRNLGCYPLVNNQYFDPKNDRCKILHYWIYNSVKNKQISNNLISDCFGDYKDHMNSISMTPNCPYHPYDDMYEEPMNMIILDIFQSNIHIIIDIVTRENYPTYLSVQQYICECVKIYKEMYNRYCPKVDAHNKKRNVTCDMLNTFKDTYKSFLSATQHKKYKIPSLDKVEADYLNMCEQEAPKLALTSQMAKISSVLQDATQEADRYSGAIPPLLSLTDENQGSPMSSTVSTAVGTVAGASSILALLYKVNK